MKKTNNRGFTLLEMLAVIAVIAILVTIIVPVVTNASDKAAAAADAANLRSAKATIALKLLDGTFKANETSISAEAAGVPEISNYNNLKFTASITDGVITVAYGDMDIAALAEIAENGKSVEEEPDTPAEPDSQ